MKHWSVPHLASASVSAEGGKPFCWCSAALIHHVSSAWTMVCVMKVYHLNECVRAAASQGDFQTVRGVNQPLTRARVCPCDGGLFGFIEIVIVWMMESTEWRCVSSLWLSGSFPFLSEPTDCVKAIRSPHPYIQLYDQQLLLQRLRCCGE